MDVMDFRRHIKVGDKLYGFCNGYFGRDSYETKVIEGVGKDWIVCREKHSVVTCEHMPTLIEFRRWLVDEDEDDEEVNHSCRICVEHFLSGSKDDPECEC